MKSAINLSSFTKNTTVFLCTEKFVTLSHVSSLKICSEMRGGKTTDKVGGQPQMNRFSLFELIGNNQSIKLLTRKIKNRSNLLFKVALIQTLCNQQEPIYTFPVCRTLLLYPLINYKPKQHPQYASIILLAVDS